MSEKSESFRDVLVWRKAHAFTLAVWNITTRFPREGRFAIKARSRRAAMSVSSDFVEGFRKRTKPGKLKFYNITQGPAYECLHPLILAHDLRFADTTSLRSDLEEVPRLLQGYINGLERNS